MAVIITGIFLVIVGFTIYNTITEVSKINAGLQECKVESYTLWQKECK